MSKTETITVTFGVELDVTNLAKLQDEFEKSSPGSAHREGIYSQLKAMRDHASARLEGEMAAHMTIARKKIKTLYAL